MSQVVEADVKNRSRYEVKCIICEQLGMDFSLTNGEAIHRQCVERLEISLTDPAKEMQDLKAIHSALVQKLSLLNKQKDSLTGFFSSFFGGRDYAVEIEAVKGDIDTSSEQIGACTSRKASDPRQRKEKEVLLKHIYDYWPDYPPDWEERRQKLIRRRNGQCQKCSATKRLQAHHEIPFWRGGSNKLKNLELLCISCHGKEHGKDFQKEGFGNNHTVISDKEELIASAINDSSKITFMYKKFDSKTGRPQKRGSRRTIRPAEFEDVKSGRRQGFSRCIRGHCDKRNAERVFAVHRMYKVEKV